MTSIHFRHPEGPSLTCSSFHYSLFLPIYEVVLKGKALTLLNSFGTCPVFLPHSSPSHAILTGSSLWLSHCSLANVVETGMDAQLSLLLLGSAWVLAITQHMREAGNAESFCRHLRIPSLNICQQLFVLLQGQSIFRVGWPDMPSFRRLSPNKKCPWLCSW